MGYTVTNILAHNDTANGSSGAKTYVSVTSSAPDTNGQLIVHVSIASGVAIATANVAAPTDSSGDGINYVLKDSAVGTNGSTLWFWHGTYYADRKCSNATRTFSVAVTGLSGANPSGCCINVDSIGGLSTFGAAIVRGSGHDSGNTNVHPNPALGAAALTTSICLTSCTENFNTGPQDTVPTSWTQSAWAHHLTPAHGLISGYINGGFTGTSVTWTGSGPGAFPWAATSIEIDTTIVTLTGQSETISEGVLTPGITVAAAGLSDTDSGGVLTPSITIQLSGLGSTMSGGSLSPAGVVPVPGLGDTMSVGALTPVIAPVASGLQDTMQQGAVSPAMTVPVPGLQQTGQQGAPVPTFSVALQGQQQTAQQGQLTPNFFVRLAGLAWQWIQGLLTYAFVRAPTADCGLHVQPDGRLMVYADGFSISGVLDGRLLVGVDGRLATLPDEDIWEASCRG